MRRAYTVSQVNRYIRNMFSGDGLLSGLQVSGEISNCKYHSSGHIYFSLKDPGGSLACVMFAGSRRGLSFHMKDGDRVVVSGRIDVYERNGTYQLYADAVRLEGEGVLYERFMRLKKELGEEGLFSPIYKQPIPKYATRIGIVTAPTGAAIRDIQNITSRRNPHVQLILYPALVQGDGAAASIVRGIRALDAIHPDVIIIGRGGGSLEDLWAFNEESVARAVFECRTPVISAVGHETDTTISDYAADLRAPTPSAAAELAVFDYAKFRGDLRHRWETMTRIMESRCTGARADAHRRQARLTALSPVLRVKNEAGRAAELRGRMTEAVLRRIRDAELRRSELQDALHDGAEKSVRENRELLRDLRIRLGESVKIPLASCERKRNLMIGRLEGLNPLSSLRRGYAYVEDAHGHAVRGIASVSEGDEVRIHVTDGTMSAEIRKVMPAESSERTEQAGQTG